MATNNNIRKLIDTYNKELLSKMDGADVTTVSAKENEQNASDPLEIYRKAMKEDNFIKVVFNYSDKNGDMSFITKDNVAIVLPHTDLARTISYYDVSLKDRFIGRPFTVRVREIDEENMTVRVANARSDEKATVSRIVAEFNRELAANEHPKVVGRVTRIVGQGAKSKLYVDILGKGIFGICAIKYWRKGFTQNFREEVQEGDLVQFEIAGAVTPRNNNVVPNQPAFVLTRENITPEPWESIPDAIEEGSIILVKCIEKPEDKTFWWGTSDLIPGIQVMCDYTRRLKIGLERTYKCKVDKLDKAGKRLQAVPFEESMVGLDALASENLRFITRKRRKAAV